MRIARCALLSLVLVVLPTMSPVWATAKDRHTKVTQYEEGHAYCPHRALVIAGVVVPAGRCYELAVLRDKRGAFLAFMDPTVRVHPGGTERLDSDEGRKARGHIFFLVPMQMTSQIALIPVNTIQLIRLREEDDEDEDEDEGHVSHSRLIVVLPSSPIPNLSVTFVVTF